MLRSFIVENNERLYLSPIMEDFIASGRNFEHTKGSVHASKLEVLFQVEKYVKQYKELVKREKKKEVKEELYAFIASHDHVGQKAKLDKKTGKLKTEGKYSHTNCERYVYLIEKMTLQPKLREAIYYDYQHNNDKSKWTINKTNEGVFRNLDEESSILLYNAISSDMIRNTGILIKILQV